MEQYYTLQEVMARLNISRDTIMGLIRKGKIPGTIKLSNVFLHPGKRHPALFGSPDRAAAQAVLRAAPTQTDQQQDAGHGERRLGRR